MGCWWSRVEQTEAMVPTCLPEPLRAPFVRETAGCGVSSTPPSSLVPAELARPDVTGIMPEYWGRATDNPSVRVFVFPGLGVEVWTSPPASERFGCGHHVGCPSPRCANELVANSWGPKDARPKNMEWQNILSRPFSQHSLV